MRGQVYHRYLSSDATFLLGKFAPSHEELAKRKQTLEEVRRALNNLCGNSFSVQDCSLHNYAVDVYGAPVEFVIVDEKNETGFPPGTDTSSLPDIYDPSCVAQTLMDAGFQGGFVSYSPDDKPEPAYDARAGQIPPPRLRDSTVPWPEYKRPRKEGLLYPPQLQAKTPLPFTLTLPGPTVLPLYNLLAAGSVTLPNTLREFISLIYIWTRSLQMVEFTPTCLALVAIRLAQDTFGRSRLDFFSDACLSESSSWVFNEAKDGSVHPVRMDTGFITPKPFKCSNSLGPLLHTFFTFWRDSVASYTLSIRENKFPSRRNPRLVAENSSSSQNDLVYDARVSEHCGFVVQDPFVKTQNHAESVSNETLRYCAYHCISNAWSIRRGHPLSAIFGEDFIPSTLNQRVNDPSDRGSPGIEVQSSRFRSTLSSELQSFCETFEPRHGVLNLRIQTIRRVQRVIQQRYGQRYTIELFGSTRYGVSSSSSDLDLVIIDSKRINGFSPDMDLGGLPSIYNVRALGATFYKNGFVNVRNIPTAMVPIVKCTDPDTGLQCDINVNDQLGLLNTGLIKHYCDLLPILRPMIGFIKHWAKPLGLNSPSQLGQPVTFSSYSLVLMTIGRLQARKLLPNLQEGLPELHDEATHGIFWARTKGGSSRCDVRFRDASNWVPQETITLEAALSDWFNYWGCDHLYAKHMISIREGGIVLRPSRNTDTEATTSREEAEEGEDDIEEEDSAEAPRIWNWGKHELVVADPFILTKNVTGNISKASVKRFRVDCQRVVMMLKWGGGLNDILGGLSSTGEMDHGDSRRARTFARRPIQVSPQAGSSRAKGKQRENTGPSGQKQTIHQDRMDQKKKAFGQTLGNTSNG